MWSGIGASTNGHIHSGIKGNIPELLLDAKQVGGRSGILADTTQILRLNTVGGVARAGSCDPETRSIATVPYQADYLFLV